MIEEGISVIRYFFDMVKQPLIWQLYILAIIMILLCYSNIEAKEYVKGIVISGIIVLNPLFAALVTRFLYSTSRYPRLLWLFFANFIIATAMTEFCAIRNKKAILFCVLIICFTGKFMYFENYEFAQNLYKVPQSVVDICDYFQEVEEYKKNNLKICVDPELSSYVRQVDAKIVLQFGRYAGLHSNSVKGGTAFYELSKKENVNVSVLVDALRTDHCQYVIIREGKVNESEMSEQGFQLMDIVDEYEVYKAVL